MCRFVREAEGGWEASFILSEQAITDINDRKGGLHGLYPRVMRGREV